MYERNAIVIDRFFTDLFGYGQTNNLKENYLNYCDLIEKLKRYQEVSNSENDMMVEFEKVANDIKEIQKMQESYYRRCLKLQETRRNLFDNLEDSADVLKKKFDKINDELSKNNSDIELNIENFINKIAEFGDKSDNRTQCGRERRIIENEYQKALQNTTENHKKIDLKYIAKAKEILKQNDVSDIKDQIRLNILKNGQKEKVAFNMDVIDKTIDIVTEIEMKKIEVFVSVYEKTGRLLNEIKNDSVKIERHEKFATDSKSKLDFMSKFIEYIIAFLDNERLNIVGGEKEHKKLMNEACKNFENDLIQIKNLYEIVIKEVSGRATKKMYKDLYKPEYVQELIEDEKQFEKSISKLNVVGTIIYPDYWRLEGMQKIFEQFKKIITETYKKDLGEYEPIYVGIENTEPKAEQYDPSQDNDNWEIEDDGFDFDGKKYYQEDDEEHEEDEEENTDDEEFEDEENDTDEEYDDIENEEEELNSDEDDYEDEEDDEDDEEEEEEESDDNDFYADVEEDDDEISEYEYDDEDKVIDEILGFGGNDKSEKKQSDFYDDEDDEIDFNWDDDEEEEELPKAKKIKAVKRKK